MKLYETLENILKKEPNFVTDNGELKKWVVIHRAQQTDSELIGLLLENQDLKTTFFKEIKGILVFDQSLFVEFMEQKNYLNNSYTQFQTKIGLNIGGKFMNQRNEVALVWAFKDCILEGGQSREEQKREEIFFNKTLAQDEITQLLEPKVLTNAKRHTSEGEKTVEKFNRNAQGTITDNFIVKGNNLLVLYSLRKEFAGKVKLIYIDPPYNTGNDGFRYNDSFNHSSWLTFMRNRLEVARDFLSDEGSIWINLDDNEAHYCKILCDEVFGRDNFVANVIWHKKNVVQNDAKYFNQNHDHILVFAKNKPLWQPNLLDRTQEMNDRYENPDHDPRGVWTSVALQAKGGSETSDYEIEFPNGVKWKAIEGTHPRLSKDNLMNAYHEGRLWFGKNGKNVPRLKKYLSEVQQGLVPNTIFSNEECGSTQLAKEELKKIMGQNIFATPKPEKLLQRIIQVSTQEKDLILDFFSGSGTSGAVAHKINRQYILIEQMDYIHDLPEARIKKVILGEQGGISKSVKWQGGGEFVYLELKKHNETFVERIEAAQDSERLLQIWESMKEKSFLHYSVDLLRHAEHIEDFKALDLEKQKKHLLNLLDTNQLYVNLSSLEDQDFACTEAEKQLTQDFYKLER